MKITFNGTIINLYGLKISQRFYLLTPAIFRQHSTEFYEYDEELDLLTKTYQWKII